MRRIDYLAKIGIFLAIVCNCHPAKARELLPGSSESFEILSIAHQKCDGFEDDSCVINELALDWLGVKLAQKTLPDGTYFTVLNLLSHDGDALSAFFDMNDRVMTDSERREYESAAWLRFRSEHGNVSPELAAQLPLLDPLAPIRVAFWLVSPNITDAVESLNCLAESTTWQDPQNKFISFATNMGIDSKSFVAVTGVPAVIGTVSLFDLQRLVRFEGIASTYLYPESEELYCNYASIWDDTSNAFPTSGMGFPVCIIEPSLPISTDLLNSAGRYFTGNGATYSRHPEFVCGMINNSDSTGCNGVSDTASCYFANWAGTPQGNISDPVYYGCILNASYIWNFSHTSGSYDSRFFDYWSERWPYPFIATSSGNDPTAAVTSKGYNTMVVNAVDDSGTVSRSDDLLVRNCATMNYRSSFINPPLGEWNPTGDRELPMISAPGMVNVLGVSIWGTSLSAPVVAGAAATLLDSNNGLIGKPWALRSILMTGASNDVDLTWFNPSDSSLDERDGAGALNIGLSGLIGNAQLRVQPGNSLPVAIGHDYQSLNLSTGFDSFGYAYNRYYIDGSNTYGSPIRVTLAWNGSSICSNAGSANTCSQSHLDANLDLIIRDVDNGNVVGYSISLDNSFEFVQFTPPAGNHTYEVLIYRASTTEPTTKYGISWIVWPFGNNDDD